MVPHCLQLKLFTDKNFHNNKVRFILVTHTKDTLKAPVIAAYLFNLLFVGNFLKILKWTGVKDIFISITIFNIIMPYNKKVGSLHFWEHLIIYQLHCSKHCQCLVVNIDARLQLCFPEVKLACLKTLKQTNMQSLRHFWPFSVICRWEMSVELCKG